MQYTRILQRAYQLTITRPQWWVVGLFLAGGFNLNLININTLVRGDVHNNAAWVINFIRLEPVWAVLGLTLILLVLFLFFNWAKTWFVMLVHDQYHDPKKIECAQCIETNKHEGTPRPGAKMVAQVITASIVTFVLTSLVSVAMNHLLKSEVNQSGVSISLATTLIIVCIIGCWNALTTYYIVLHRLNFNAGAKASLDLLSLKTKTIFEFVVILSLLYSGSVLIGSLLINAFNADVAFIFLPLRFAAITGFFIWSAVTNVYFNVSMQLFFNELVKPIKKEEPAVVSPLPATAE